MKTHIMSILEAEQYSLSEMFELANSLLTDPYSENLRKFDKVENMDYHIYVPLFKGLGQATFGEPDQQPPFTARFVIYQHIFPEKKQYLKIRYDYRNTEGDVEYFDELKASQYQQIKGNFNKTEYAIKFTLEKTIGLLEDTSAETSWFFRELGLKTYSNQQEINAKTADYLAELGYEHFKVKEHDIYKEAFQSNSMYRLGIMTPVYDRGTDAWGDVASSIGGVITLIEGHDWDK